jgi:dephospho-CoA kinase
MTITIEAEQADELEFKVILRTQLTKKQEQEKNKLIQDNAQTIEDYYTLKKEKECLERKMNTLHLQILTNFSTLSNTYHYTDQGIVDFNFE